jgi:predicted ester cyclase
MASNEEEVVAGPNSNAATGIVAGQYRVPVSETVVVRGRAEATHTGDFLGIAPTGRRVTSDPVALVWVHDGRVVGQWAQPDLWAIHRQLTA